MPIGDLLAGMYGAYGAVAALHERERTGRGTVVRTSLLAALVGVHAFQGTRYTVAARCRRGQGNHHPSICPYGLFECADGMLQIAVGSEALWRRFAPAFDLPLDAPGFARNPDRVGNRDAVIAAVNAAFAPYPLAELLPRLAEVGIPSGEVRTLDRVYDWDQTLSQGLLIEVDHPLAGPLRLPGPAVRFDGSTRCTTRPADARPARRQPSARGSTGWTTDPLARIGSAEPVTEEPMSPEPPLHKADFGTIYDRPDPRAYYATLEPLDYGSRSTAATSPPGCWRCSRREAGRPDGPRRLLLLRRAGDAAQDRPGPRQAHRALHVPGPRGADGRGAARRRPGGAGDPPAPAGAAGRRPRRRRLTPSATP